METNYDTWLNNQSDIDEYYGDEHYREERERQERRKEIERERMLRREQDD